MRHVVSYLINQLNAAPEHCGSIIPWSCPVPSFGNVMESTVATVGINPSNKEFVEDDNRELAGQQRRFHTLRSLGLNTWAEADAPHHDQIADACESYFATNPYDRWFRQLDYLISGTNFSYYSPLSSACHLDLVPFATSSKWAMLPGKQRTTLLAIGGDALGYLIRDSPVRLLILNGRSVVTQFQQLADATLVARCMPTWELPRPQGAGVPGFAYQGAITRLGGIKLKRRVLVLGFNHNIQSSFGVTRDVKASIRHWITRRSRGRLT